MAVIKYAPLPFQRKAHFSEKPKVLLSGGYGCGKTYWLCMKMFQLMDLNRRLPGGLLCPDYGMFLRDVLPTIEQICDANNIDFKYHRTHHYFRFPDTKSQVYVFHDIDKGASIRGPNLAFMLINEIGLISRETFMAAIARVRIKGAKLQTAMSGTPESFNWVYDYFIQEPRQDTEIIYGNSRENIHVDGGYVDMLTESYDELMREQYVEGKFVNLVGKRALHAFNRFKHVKPVERDPILPVWVSLDFNVTPMAATLWNRMPADSVVKLKAFDEIALNSSDTDQMADEIIRKVGTDCTIFPDPAGNARSTKSNKSDIDILKQKGFQDIRFKRSITSVRDCINAFNAMLSRGYIEIDPKCKNLIADCEQVIFKGDSFTLDKSNPMRTHWLDGAKDMIDYEFPIKMKSGSWREVNVR